MDETPRLEMDLSSPLAEIMQEISPGAKIPGSVVLGGLPPDEYGNLRYAFYVQGTSAPALCNAMIGFLNKMQEGGGANDETF